MKISSNFKKVAAVLAPVAVGGLFLATVGTAGSVGAGDTAIKGISDWFVQLLSSDILRLICLVMLVVAMVSMIMGKGLQAGLLGLVGVGFIGLVAPSLITGFTSTLPTADQIHAIASSVMVK